MFDMCLVRFSSFNPNFYTTDMSVTSVVTLETLETQLEVVKHDERTKA